MALEKYNGEWQISIKEDFSWDVSVYIFRHVIEGTEMLKVGKNGSLEYGAIIPHGGSKDVKPTFQLPPETLQSLFDALQKRGMKPSDQSFVEGKLQATEKHLEDMRKIAFEIPTEVINIDAGASSEKSI